MNSENSSNSKKKKVAASAVAVALAAALMIGGTFSYIAVTSEEVENEFDTDNNISVELEENTGKEYEVVPGVTEEKDPVITLTTTMDTYVFLLVEDNTYDLVDYAIDAIWTLLYDADDDDNPEQGYDIYYALIDFSEYSSYTTSDNEEAEYDEIELKLNVLAGQSVSYGSWITADDLDLTDDDGNELEVTLSFMAYAIQAEPFSTANYDDEDIDTAAAKAALTGYYTPQAKVTVSYTSEAVSVSSGYGDKTAVGTITPDVVYTFTATDTTDSTSYSIYKGWYADYYVTFDTDGADSEELAKWNGYVAMAGQYDSYSTEVWIPITIQAYSSGSAKSYNLMREVLETGEWLTYANLIEYVGTFTCGTVQTVSSDNASTAVVQLATSVGGIDVPDGVVMTVELRLYKETSGSTGYGDTYVTIGSYSYTFGSQDDGITNVTGTVTDSTEESTTD